MIIDNLRKELLSRRKAKDKTAVVSLSFIIGELGTMAKRDGLDAPTDQMVVSTIKKVIENNNGNMNISPELCEELTVENALLSQFLPKETSESEVKLEIESLIANGAKEMRDIMPHLKNKFGTSLNGGKASAIARSML